MYHELDQVGCPKGYTWLLVSTLVSMILTMDLYESILFMHSGWYNLSRLNLAENPLWYMLKDPFPPWIAKKHLLVQSRVERTAFSDQHVLFIEYISNFFHMYEIFLLLYQVLDKLSFLIRNFITLIGYIELTFKF